MTKLYKGYKVPDEYHPSWPGVKCKCSVCGCKFIAVGRVDKIDKENDLCWDCFTELNIIDNVEIDVHRVVDKGDTHY
jgi:hypothetical protein